ncbi:uncharacterized protein LOC106665614 isoform X2 [Cimex lectularius]|uniref:Uncharacterized protein n=1 Tax=Cimex lectularius TaxID=79782 RepID=A0A8I6RPA2_CIMLE|nr:uncharacterized protein LOC106665614 isoform X2 [Cimex lectularius]
MPTQKKGFRNELYIKVGLPNNEALRLDSSELGATYEKTGNGEFIATLQCSKSCLFSITNNQLLDQCKVDIHVYRKDIVSDFPRIGSCCVDLGGQFLHLLSRNEDNNCKSRYDTFFLKNILQGTVGTVTLSVRITYYGTKFSNKYGEANAGFKNLSPVGTLSPAPSRKRLMTICACNEITVKSSSCDLQVSNMNVPTTFVEEEVEETEDDAVASNPLPPYFENILFESLQKELSEYSSIHRPVNYNKLKINQEKYLMSSRDMKSFSKMSTAEDTNSVGKPSTKKKRKVLGCDDRNCPYFGKVVRSKKPPPAANMCCPLTGPEALEDMGYGSGKLCVGCGGRVPYDLDNDDSEEQRKDKKNKQEAQPYFVQPVYCLIPSNISCKDDEQPCAVFVRPKKIVPIPPWVNTKKSNKVMQTPSKTKRIKGQSWDENIPSAFA